MVRVVPEEASGLVVFLGAEFHPPAIPEPEPIVLPDIVEDEEIEEPQPIVPGQPTADSPRVKKGTRKVAASGPEVDGNVAPAPKRARKAAGSAAKAAPRKRSKPAASSAKSEQ